MRSFASGLRSAAKVDAFVALVTITGAAVCLHAVVMAPQRSAPDWRAILLGAALFYLGERAMFSLRFGRDSQSFNWLEAAVVVGLVLIPVPWLSLVAAAGISITHLQRRRPLVKVAFNALSCATGVVLSRIAFALTAGSASIDELTARTWLGLIAGSFAFFVWNGLTVSIAVALSQGMRLRDVHDRGLILNVLVWLGNTALGLLIVALADSEPLLLGLVPVMLVLLSLAYRAYLRALQDRDAWQVLLSASRELLRVDQDDLLDIVLERSAALFDADVVEVVLLDDPAGARAKTRRRSGEGPTGWRAGSPEELAPHAWRRGADVFDMPGGAEAAMVGVARVAVAPLTVQGERVGALRLGFVDGRRFSPRLRPVIGTFVNNVSSALHNARLFEESRHRALHDPLTGLPNRMLLMDRLQHSLDIARRRELSVAVLFLDLDRFKVVNDSLGHELGDRLLVAAARRIASVLRPGDTATRFGGDEFVVVCDDVASPDDALDIANRLAQALVAPFDLAGHEVYVTASVGVALSTPDTPDAGSLIRDADAAMYRAKDGGRARAELFDARMRTDAVERLETENDLRRAIDRGELRLYYQPAFDLETGAMEGVEALVRWDHPDKGLVPPSLFVPLAEETGLISRVTEWVAEQACTDLAAWRASGRVGDDFTVAINLSATELVDADVVDTIVSAVGRHRLSPAQITVEITETALLGDLDRALSVLERLRRFGVTVALDDFGTGYSSLSYLRRLPVNALKVDRSFIASLGEDTRDGAVVAAVVDLAHALGLHVVAEGVEDARQVLALRGLGCDSAQGWYFSHAVPAAELFPPQPPADDSGEDDGPLAPIISIA